MRSIIFIFLLTIDSFFFARALVLSEVMSNPIGDDGGREWIEIYNPTDSDIDIAGMTVSIKGGAPIFTAPVSGGTTLTPHMFGIIASTVSGQTKFLLDYPSYNGLLLKSSISLVNTGITSISLGLHGSVADSIPSYTAAKEGSTYSLIEGVFVAGAPTPGADNVQSTSGTDSTSTTTNQSGNQVTLSQMSSPSADIVLFLPFEKTVVAGAPALFSTQGMTRAGKPLDNMSYLWSFGEGGQGTGSSTLYRYLYPGRYILQVEGGNGLVLGIGRMIVNVVAPDISITPIEQGKYGNYIDITNPNSYDLDISGWKMSLDGALFSFPKNTLLGTGSTHFSGIAMGFASTTISTSTVIKLLFPTMEEVVRIIQGTTTEMSPQNTVDIVKNSTKLVPTKVVQKIEIRQRITKDIIQQKTKATSTVVLVDHVGKKDVRLASFFKSLFGR